MVGVNIGVPAPHPYIPFGGIKDSLVGTNKVQARTGSASSRRTRSRPSAS